MVIIIAVIYFCFDKEAGRLMAYAVFNSNGVNGCVKDYFKLERPIGLDGVRSRGTEDLKVVNSPTGYGYSYSFPSGHTQTSASCLTALAANLKRKWFTVIATVFPVFVGLSRVYDGVHFPKDVLVGYLLGLLVTGVSVGLWTKVKNKHALYAVSFAVLFVAMMIYGRTDDTVKIVGAYAGFILGTIFDDRLVGLENPDRWWKGVVRLAAVVGVLLGIRALTKLVFPTTLVFVFLRYTIMIFFAVGPYPMLLKKFKL